MEIVVLNKLEMVFCILTVGWLLFSALIQNKNTMKTVKMVKEMLFFSHRKYLLWMCVFSTALIIISYLTRNLKDTWFSTVCISTSLSILAGIIVAIYSEYKNTEIDERKCFLDELRSFDETVNGLAVEIDFKTCLGDKIAIEYLKLLDKQEVLQQKYDRIKTKKGPTPAFGDSELDVVEEITNRIHCAFYEENLEPMKNRDEIIEGIRGSLAIMQNQNRMCRDRITDEMKMASKVL